MLSLAAVYSVNTLWLLTAHSWFKLSIGSMYRSALSGYILNPEGIVTFDNRLLSNFLQWEQWRQWHKNTSLRGVRRDSGLVTCVTEILIFDKVKPFFLVALNPEWPLFNVSISLRQYMDWLQRAQNLWDIRDFVVTRSREIVKSDWWVRSREWESSIVTFFILHVAQSSPDQILFEYRMGRFSDFLQPLCCCIGQKEVYQEAGQQVWAAVAHDLSSRRKQIHKCTAKMKAWLSQR